VNAQLFITYNQQFAIRLWAQQLDADSLNVPEVVRRVGRKSTSSCAQCIDTLGIVGKFLSKARQKKSRSRLLVKKL
jgi:hypothetical protein